MKLALIAIAAVGHNADGESIALTASDPHHELAPLPIDGRGYGTETIEYLAGDLPLWPPREPAPRERELERARWEAALARDLEDLDREAIRLVDIAHHAPRPEPVAALRAVLEARRAAIIVARAPRPPPCPAAPPDRAGFGLTEVCVELGRVDHAVAEHHPVCQQVR